MPIYQELAEAGVPLISSLPFFSSEEFLEFASLVKDAEERELNGVTGGGGGGGGGGAGPQSFSPYLNRILVPLNAQLSTLTAMVQAQAQGVCP